MCLYSTKETNFILSERLDAFLQKWAILLAPESAGNAQRSFSFVLKPKAIFQSQHSNIFQNKLQKMDKLMSRKKLTFYKFVKKLSKKNLNKNKVM